MLTIHNRGEAELNVKKAVLVLFLLRAGFSLFAQDPVFDYTESNNTISITYYFEREPHVVIPADIDRRRVVSIATGAFASNNLVSVVIPESIKEIGAAAFTVNKLLTIVLGSGVNIATSAFEAPFIECYNRNRKAGGVYAFYDNLWHYFGAFTSGMVPVVQGNRITIVKYAGQDRNVSIPGQINSIPVSIIGRAAFAGREIHSVRIPNGVHRIEDDAFLNNRISRLELPGSVVDIGRRAFSRNSITRLTLPAGLTAIADEAFFDNMLSRVEIPAGVISIGSRAFSVNLLTEVILPASLRIILDDAFSLNQLTGLDIPASIAQIGSRAFFNNRLTDLTLPESVTVVDDEAFSVNQLEILVLPPGLKRIGNRAFYQNKLTVVFLPENLAEIGSGAFGKNQIVNIRIPKSVDTIGAGAFADNALTSILWLNSPVSGAPPAGRGVIAAGAFAHNGITSLSAIPDWITDIGEQAFYGNPLESLVIPPSVERIGPSAFTGNSRLDRITIQGGDGVVAIDEYAFDNGFTPYYEARRQPGIYARSGGRWSWTAPPPPEEEPSGEEPAP
jgi:hypothetical protein